MQVQLADAGTLSKRVTISYDANEVAARKAQLIKHLSGEVKLDGFRPGKASKAVLEKRYGAAASAQAEEALADEGLKKALADNKLRPFGRIANDEVKRDKGFSITVSFELYPDITLPAASGFQVDKGDDQVSDKELDEALQGIAKRLGEMSPLAADEAVIADDSITVSGSVSVAGTEIRKLHDFHHLVGGYPLFGKAPADVVALLTGKKIGDQIAFTATLPANFSPAEHAGKEAAVSFTIQVANRLRAATLDDELAKKVGAPDLAGLKEMMKARLGANKTNALRAKQVEQLAAALIEKVSVELPPKAFAEAVTGAEKEAAERAKADGKDEAAAKAEAKANVEKGFKRHLVMTALSDQLAIEVTNDDFRDQIMMAASQTGRKPQDIATQLQKSGQISQVAMEIREAKAIEAFLDQVLGKKPAEAAKA